jgi:hypothetical protein
VRWCRGALPPLDKVQLLKPSPPRASSNCTRRDAATDKRPMTTQVLDMGRAYVGWAVTHPTTTR